MPLHFGSPPPQAWQAAAENSRRLAIQAAMTVSGHHFVGSLGLGGPGIVETSIRPSDIGAGPTWHHTYRKAGWHTVANATTGERTILSLTGFFISVDLSNWVTEAQIEANDKQLPVFNLERLAAVPRVVKVMLPWGHKGLPPEDAARLEVSTREVHLAEPFIIPEESPVRFLVRTRGQCRGAVGLMGSAFNWGESPWVREP